MTPVPSIPKKIASIDSPTGAHATSTLFGRSTAIHVGACRSIRTAPAGELQRKRRPIDVADRLSEDGVSVDGMILFDAVDRSLAINSTEIPRNVLRLVHARRNPQTNSRHSFSNCGTVWHAPTKTTQAFFWGTHGALGGVPNLPPKDAKSTDLISEYFEPTGSKVSYAQDRRCASEVWTWVSPHVERLGFLGGKPSQASNS